jgi:hypothetical protein
MKRTSRICAEGRMRRFLVVAATVAVIALAAESASASSQKTWINASGCASPGFGLVWAQHPARIGVTCDPHDQIVGARWRNWGQAKTQATATLAVDNCNPSCATGRVRRYAITLVASKIRRCGTRRVYASVIFYEKIAGRRRTNSVPAEGFC